MLDLHRGHVIGLAVDVWALGCLLFSLAYCRHSKSIVSRAIVSRAPGYFTLQPGLGFWYLPPPLAPLHTPSAPLHPPAGTLDPNPNPNPNPNQAPIRLGVASADPQL